MNIIFSFLSGSDCSYLLLYVHSKGGSKQWQARKWKRFTEICLWEKEEQTEICIDPTFMRSFVVYEQCVAIYFCVVVFFIRLLLTDVNLLLTFGLDATDRSVKGKGGGWGGGRGVGSPVHTTSLPITLPVGWALNISNYPDHLTGWVGIEN